jgi:hypothetical protein
VLVLACGKRLKTIISKILITRELQTNGFLSNYFRYNHSSGPTNKINRGLYGHKNQQ